MHVMTWGQILYVLSLAHIVSLSIPYMKLLFWHLLAVNLLPLVFFIRPSHDCTFASELMWQTAQVTEPETNLHSQETIWDLFFLFLSLDMHPYILDSIMLGTGTIDFSLFLPVG